MTQLLHTTVESPIGELLLVGDGHALRLLHMQGSRKPAAVRPEWRRDDDAFANVRAQLEEYFAGERTSFDVPLALEGSPFDLRVWRALQEIAYGETISYGELARAIGQPSASRAVGAANGRNPLSIVVPCHRVIGSDGSLTGYGGGEANKRWLLEHEARLSAPLFARRK